jgi:hypothetical protein
VRDAARARWFVNVGDRMGLFGNKGRDRELDKITDFVRKHEAAGETQFVVPVYLMANGAGLLSIRRMEEDAAEHLRGLGYSVTDVRVEDWEYKAYMQVAAVASRRHPADGTPLAGAAGSETAAPPHDIGGADAEDPERLDQWYRSALSPWKSPSMEGRTLAPNYGFEDALQVIRQPGASEPIFQAVASNVADGVISLIRQGMPFDEYDRVLGMSVPQLRSVGLRRDRDMMALSTKLDASKDALVGLATMDPGRLSAWGSSHEVRQECFVYHAAFLGRVGQY